MQKKCFLKTSVAAIAAAILFPLGLYAQSWQLITANVPGVPGGNVRPIESDGTRLYVLGYRGVYVSADDGNSFSPINEIAGGSYSLTNMPYRFLKYVNGSLWIGSDPGSGAINSGYASLHRLTPGETVWQKCSNGFPIGDTGNQADDIAFDASIGTYYVASSLGGAFVSTDGTNWVQRSNGLGGLGVPSSVVAFNGMAFELRPLSQVCKTSDRGTNWTTLTSHQGISSGYLLEKNGRIMFASSGNNTTQDGFNYSDDYGVTWNFLTGLKGTADLTLKDGVIYAAGLFGGLTESVYGRYGFKFSATDGLTWDNLPTNGLPADVNGGFNAIRVVRQGNYLFTQAGTNLFRYDVTGFDFRPTTQIARQPVASTNRLVGQPFTLSVVAGGTNMAYQWRLNGTNIGGATGAAYAIATAQTNQSGSYTVAIVGDRGSVTSSVANVTVIERVEGKYDITYNNPTTGGQLFLLPDSNVVSVVFATLYKIGADGGRMQTRAISGANFTVSTLDNSNRVVVGNTSGGYRLRRFFANDLTDDTNFIQSSFSDAVGTVTEWPGHGYLVGGGFSSIVNPGVSTNAAKCVCLVDYSGKFDPSFSVGTGPNSLVTKIVVDSGTNIYVQGLFSFWNGNSASGFVKLNTNGTVNTNFASTLSGFFQVYTPGKLFAIVGTKPVLVNPDGSMDAGFNPSNYNFNAVNTVKTAAIGESNNVYLAGTFTSYGGKTVGKYIRLLSNGNVDTNFDSSVAPTSGGFASSVYDPRGYLYLIRDTSSGTFQGQSFGTGPYRLFAGTNAVAATGFNAWTAQFTFPPGQSDPEDDADGDGLVNIFEFYFGSNPTNAASGAKPVIVSVNVGGQNYPALTFTRSKNAAGVTPVPQASSSVLFNDSLGTTLQSVADLGDGTERVTIRSNVSIAAQSAQFLRILLSMP